MTDDTGTRRAAERRQSVVVTIVGVLLAAHGVLLALYLAPSGPVRDAAGSARLASYVDPYFQQSDETVGVGSHRVDETLVVRAAVRPRGGGKATVTPWFDVTAAETRAMRGQLDPPRARLASRRLATNVNYTMIALTPGQRTAVAKITADDSSLQVQQRLLAAGRGTGREAVEAFVAQDQMASRFASLWITAMRPDVEVASVQYRVGRRVVPGPDRGAPRLSDTAFEWFDTGWRSAWRGDPEARSSFETYVEREGDDA